MASDFLWIVYLHFPDTMLFQLWALLDIWCSLQTYAVPILSSPTFV